MDYKHRPEPGRFIGRERIIEKTIEKQTPQPQVAPIDLTALANAVAVAISGILPHQSTEVRYVDQNNQQIRQIEDFDNSKTLDKLAKSMIVQRGDSTSNFNNLGNEQHTKTNSEENAKTIDLLSKLDD